MRKHLLTAAAGTVLMLSASGSTPTPNAVQSAAEIRKILIERIDTFHQGVGIVVGVI